MKKIELEIAIPKELDGKRLDVALSKLLPEYSRSKIQSWIKAGEVEVNNLNHRQRDVINANDIVRINTALKDIGKDQAEAIELNVIHEDDEIIIINKQAGLVVHPVAGNQRHTLVNALLHFDEKLNMIIARTIKSHTYLVNELQKRNIKRNYRALICGQLISGGTIENKIGRHPIQRTKMAITDKGKLAITHYKIVKKFQHYSYLNIRLDTGRTHQIRVHMNSINHPLIGDPLYGINSFLKK